MKQHTRHRGEPAAFLPLVLLVLLALALASFGCDPVQSDEKAALGDETPGVRTGPLHRPGQPCTVCHDGKLGDPEEWSVAGTIYRNENDLVAASNATVNLTDANGKTYNAITNEAGNFYMTPSQFDPAYPMKVIVTYNGSTVPMTSNIGRAGACSGCHVDPAGPTSPGHVFVPTDGVVP